LGNEEFVGKMTHLLGLHRQPGDEREEHDFYATHPHAVPPLLRLLGKSVSVIREPCCGMGHLSIPMEIAGKTVISTDLVDRGYGVPGVNFLTQNPLFDSIPTDAVVMNPPYKLAQEFIEKALTLAPVVAAFLRISFLESETREEFYRKHPPRYVACFSRRARSAKHGDFSGNGGPILYAWFIWHVGYQGDPSIKWIHPEETESVRQTLKLIPQGYPMQSGLEQA
jgi:predicted RNA methylase